MFELSMWHNACFWNAWFRCQGANWYQRLSARPAGGSSGVKTTRHHPQTIQRVAASPQPVQGIARRFYRSMFLIGMKQRKLSESLFLIEYITRYHKISQVIAFCFCLRALDRIRYAFPLTRSNSNSTSCVPNGDWEYGAAPQAARRTWVIYEFKLICVICDGSSWCAATWHNV